MILMALVSCGISIISTTVLYSHIRRSKYNFRFKMIASIVRGTPITISSTEHQRYVLLTSAVCSKTFITIDLKSFSEAVDIAFGFTTHHGTR